MPLTPPSRKPAAAPAAHADLTVRVNLGGQDLAGELLVDGRPAGTFRGWVGLLTALDRALDTLQLSGPETGAT